MVSNLLQHEDSFFPSEIVAILQMRGLVILGFSQLGKFIVEKQPKLQHSSKGSAQLCPRRHLYSRQTIFGVQIGTSCNNCSSWADNNLLRPYCQSSSEKDTFPKSIFSSLLYPYRRKEHLNSIGLAESRREESLGAKELGHRRQVCGKPKGCVDGYVFLLEGKVDSRC